MSVTFVSHLECSFTGETFPAGQVYELSRAGWPLLVRYDLERMAKTVTKQDICDSVENGFWRYAPFFQQRPPTARCKRSCRSP